MKQITWHPFDPEFDTYKLQMPYTFLLLIRDPDRKPPAVLGIPPPNNKRPVSHPLRPSTMSQ